MEEMYDTKDMGVVDIHPLNKAAGCIALWVDWVMTCAPLLAPLDLGPFPAGQGVTGCGAEGCDPAGRQLPQRGEEEGTM